MNFKKTILFLALAIGASDCVGQEAVRDSTNEIVLASEIRWQPLNPKRGKDGPQAGTLWGDQTKAGASGFLVKFVDGFSSPPHIHNITYRGVVIGGGLYNGVADVEPMWMPAGSYWTQPVGHPHITAARGASVAYVEIQEGPYLVLPTEKASDNGERPINVDASNIVWLDASSTSWIKQPTETGKSNKGPELAFLWGKPQGDALVGTLVKLPAGFTGTIRSNGSTLRAVVIAGQLQYETQDEADGNTLLPGSYFDSQGKATYQVSCNEECIAYVRSEGNFAVIQTLQEK